MPFRKMVKLLLSGTPKKLTKLFSPPKPIRRRTVSNIFSLKSDASPTRKIKAVPALVPNTWPYTSSARAANSPSVATDAGEFLSGSYTNQAGSRSYKLFVPSLMIVDPPRPMFGESSTALRPLIVMLHGCTQNPDDFAVGTGMNTLAEAQKCFVLYPAQSSAANQHGCWNWFKKANQRVGHGEPAIIAGITKDIIQRYPVDPSRVYIAGLSAGGALAASMALLYPDLYAAAGVHSGLPYASANNLATALSAMRSGIYSKDFVSHGQVYDAPPVIVFHGDQDNTVSPVNADRLIEQFTKSDGNQLDVEKNKPRPVQQGKMQHGRSYSATSYDDAEGTTVAEQWTIHGAGHAWSGGKSAGSYTDPSGPDASQEMLRFFLTQKLMLRG